MRDSFGGKAGVTFGRTTEVMKSMLSGRKSNTDEFTAATNSKDT